MHGQGNLTPPPSHPDAERMMELIAPPTPRRRPLVFASWVVCFIVWRAREWHKIRDHHHVHNYITITTVTTVT